MICYRDQCYCASDCTNTEFQAAQQSEREKYAELIAAEEE